MSRIIDDDPPIKTGVASDAYRENWDRVFGECSKCSGTGCVIDPDVDPTTVETDLEYESCNGYYDDGVMPTCCQNREGCGRVGCPAADFGVTFR